MEDIMRPYKHIQIGYLIIAVFSTVLLGMLLLMLTNRFHGIVFGVFLVLLFCLWMFATLTVEVDDTHLRFWFGKGLSRKTFPLEEIMACRVVTNPWYHGWGIHLTPQGWLYNVSGRVAVELKLKNGKGLRLGTDDPEGLIQAIQPQKED